MSSVLAAVSVTDPIELLRLCQSCYDDSPQPMLAVQGSTHVIRYCNPAFANLVAKTSEELTGLRFVQVIPEANVNGCLAFLDSVLETGAPKTLADQEHRQSPLAFWSYSMWPIRGADKEPVGVMIQVAETTDTAQYRRQATAMNEALIVSAVRQHELIDAIRRSEQEKQELQLQLFQTKKLDSLGVLAGGIAHDLNNILTPVIGFAELASYKLPADSAAVPMLQEVRNNARRAADLVQQILAFAGKGRFIIQSVNLTDLVRGMAGQLSSNVSANTKLVYDLAPTLSSVDGDATQLQQLLLNLVINASESLSSEPGTVTIRTGTGLPDDCDSRSTDANPVSEKGPLIFLEVVDTGCGMNADLIERVFDPFFTTKFTGRGMGLAIVQGIARGHRGILEVQSKCGSGSTFRLLVPRSKTAPVPNQGGATASWKRGDVVLIVDDEKQVLRISTAIVEAEGLTVLVAGDGLEALEVFREHRESIGVVLLDLTMPKMGGLEAAKQLNKLRQDLPIVLMSGYSIEEMTFQSSGLRISGFVQKPFNVIQLRNTVRQAIGEPVRSV